MPSACFIGRPSSPDLFMETGDLDLIYGVEIAGDGPAISPQQLATELVEWYWTVSKTDVEEWWDSFTRDVNEGQIHLDPPPDRYKWIYVGTPLGLIVIGQHDGMWWSGMCRWDESPVSLSLGQYYPHDDTT